MANEKKQATNNPDCLFCKIIDKEIPAHVVYEDEWSLAFLDITPRTTGHTLVIPKYHAPTIITLPDQDVDHLFETVKKVADLVTKKLKADGATIGMNQGRASGQEVDHLHVHIMPRWHNDGGHSIQSIINSKPEESVEEIKKKIIG